MTMQELVRRNRSYRGFSQERKITREELLELVECARLCPSSVNAQPLKYYLAWEKETVAAIQPLTRWAGGLPQLNLPLPGTEPTAFVVICQDTDIDANIARFQKDVGIVAQTMLLRAVELGLGGCMIGSFQAGQLRQALNLPEKIAPQLVVALGEPTETVVLTEVPADGNTHYYRDEKNTHYVPKRSLEEVIL